MALQGNDTKTSEGTSADTAQLVQRSLLESMYTNSPLPLEHMMFNLGMYVRSSLLVKFLFMDDIYKRVTHLPGVLIEFGVWWGQNLVLMENLRAIHEPFNKQRVILGFDTFDGYRTFTDKDVRGDVMSDGTYATPADYKQQLAQLLEAHEGANAFGHQKGKHQLIEGDVTKTAHEYFEANPQTLVAMAFFDIGTYLPTLEGLKAIKSSLMPGSVIVFDELTWNGAPGEAIAFKEVFKDIKYKIERSHLYPSKAIVTIVSV